MELMKGVAGFVGYVLGYYESDLYLYVKFVNGRTVEVEIPPSSTGRQLRELVESTSQLSGLVLIYAGRRLTETDVLKDRNIWSNCTLHAVEMKRPA